MKIKEQKQRPEMRSFCCSHDLWDMAKEVANTEGKSISSMIRENIKRLYAKMQKQKKEVETKTPI